SSASSIVSVRITVPRVKSADGTTEAALPIASACAVVATPEQTDSPQRTASARPAKRIDARLPGQHASLLRVRGEVAEGSGENPALVIPHRRRLENSELSRKPRRRRKPRGPTRQSRSASPLLGNQVDAVWQPN